MVCPLCPFSDFHVRSSSVSLAGETRGLPFAVQLNFAGRFRREPPLARRNPAHFQRAARSLYVDIVLRLDVPRATFVVKTALAHSFYRCAEQSASYLGPDVLSSHATIVAGEDTADRFPYAMDGPRAPSELDAVRLMLQLADVKPGELVVHLGAGDGRILFLAARESGMRALGAPGQTGAGVETGQPRRLQ